VHRLVRAMLRSGADARGGAIRSDDPQPWKTELARSQGKHAVPGIRDQGLGIRKTVEGPIAADELNDIAVESSQAERRAADAERELIEWKKMKFMADKIGDDFPAVILSATKYGFFVELEDMFIEGQVPISSLVGDYYSFRDTDRTIVGSRTGHVFSLGQRVHVLLDRIDRQQRRLQFALLPGTEPKVVAGAGSLGRGGKSEAKKAKAKEKKVGGKAKARQRKKR
jgi:ribonuclease R